MYDLRILKLFYNVNHYNVPSYFFFFFDTLNDTCKQYNLHNTVIRTPYYNQSFAEKKLLFDVIQLFKNYLKTILNKMQTHSLKVCSNFIKQALINKYEDNCPSLNCFACMRYV